MERFLQTRHLIQIDDLSRAEIEEILALAEFYLDLNKNKVRQKHHLQSFTQINVFFENSTRTKISFELAEKRLSADVTNFSASSSGVGSRPISCNI